MADKQRKTAKQKAEEEVTRLTKRVATLDKQFQTAATKAAALETDLANAKRELEYVKQHPALTQPSPDEHPPGAQPAKSDEDTLPAGF
jgi:predicted  nucleic acid-binding Zn-ribbon protein